MSEASSDATGAELPARAPVRFGCPFWAFKEWAGSLYSSDARSADYLVQYARVFDTVEGNTTFYHAPTPETVLRWREATPATFRFCFKLPREITHDQRLVGVEKQTTRFLNGMSPLGERLGPFMIQLPASFGPRDLADLERFLDGLPAEHAFAVELRHPDFFVADGEACLRVDALLATRGHDRVIMDTRPLRTGDTRHPAILEARHKKPDLPLHPNLTGGRPLARIVLHPEHETNEPFLDEWVDRIRNWLAESTSPYVFLHTPSNLDTPARIRTLHARLAKFVPLAPLPEFPGDAHESAAGQLPLFRT